jgi:DNA repair exonuclease SbcCD ATPase subunit
MSYDAKRDKKKIEEVQTIDNSKASILQQQVSSLTDDINTLSQNLTSVRGKIPNDLSGTMSQITDDLNTLAQTVTSVQGKIPSDLSGTMSKLTDDIDSLSQSLMSVQGKIPSDLTSTISLITDDLNTLSQNVTSISGKVPSNLSSTIAELNDQLEQVKNNIPTDLSGTVSRLTNQVSTIDDKTKQLETSTQDLGSLKSTVRSLDVTLQDKAQQLDDVHTKVSSNETQTRNNHYRLQGMISDIEDNQQRLESLLRMTEAYRTLQGEAMIGNMHLYADAYEANIEATELNGADAGDCFRDFTISLTRDQVVGEETNHDPHLWCSLKPVLESDKAVNDSDISIPVVQSYDDPESDPQLYRGSLRLKVIFDTGAGKTYIAGDYLTVTIKVAADDKLLGYTIEEFVMAYHVI